MDNIFDELELVPYNSLSPTDNIFNDLLDSTKGEVDDEEIEKGIEEEAEFIGQQTQGVIKPLDNLEEEDEEEEEETEEEEVVDTTKPLKEVKKVDDNPDEEESETEDDEERNTYFEKFGEALVKMGAFTKLEEGQHWSEEIWLEKDKERAKTMAMEEVENFVREKHGERGASLFEDLFVKGASIDDYLTILKEEVAIDKIELDSNPNNQEYIVRMYYKKLEYDEDDIDEVIEGLKATDKLEYKSELFKDKLVRDAQQQRETQALKSAEIKKDIENNKRKYQSEVKKVISKALQEGEIKSIPLSKTDSSLESYMLGEKYQLPGGQLISEFQKDLFEIQKDPELAAALAKLVKEKLDITPIKKKAKSQKLDLEFERVATTKSTKTNAAGSQILKNLFK